MEQLYIYICIIGVCVQSWRYFGDTFLKKFFFAMAMPCLLIVIDPISAILGSYFLPFVVVVVILLIPEAKKIKRHFHNRKMDKLRETEAKNEERRLALEEQRMVQKKASEKTSDGMKEIDDILGD